MERPASCRTPAGRRARQHGTAAETAALHFLEAQGLRLVCRNYQSRYGEIDLVMQQEAVLVFAEVRLRRHTAFGGAFASVTLAKQQKVIACAGAFLHHHPHFAGLACRFDVLSVLPDTQGWQVEWLPAAFTT